MSGAYAKGRVVDTSGLAFRPHGRSSRFARHFERIAKLRLGQSYEFKPDRVPSTLSSLRCQVGFAVKQKVAPPRGCRFLFRVTANDTIAVSVVRLSVVRHVT